MRTARRAAVLLFLLCYATSRTPGQAPSTSLDRVVSAYDAVKKLNDLNREYQQKLDAGKFLEGYSMIERGDPERTKKIANLYEVFPNARQDPDVRDILAADEKELEKNPHPQEEEESLDSAGFLFLKERTSVRNVNGNVVALNPYTKVRRLSIKGDTFTVIADGVNAFDVPRDKLNTGRQDVLAMSQQKQQESAQLAALVVQFGTAALNAATQDKRRQLDEQRITGVDERLQQALQHMGQQQQAEQQRQVQPGEPDLFPVSGRGAGAYIRTSTGLHN